MKPLTPQELLCLKWVAMGKTSWETGCILGLAERTINYHIHNACRKLGVHGRQAAVTAAMRSGLLTLEEACADACRSRPPPRHAYPANSAPTGQPPRRGTTAVRL